MPAVDRPRGHDLNEGKPDRSPKRRTAALAFHHDFIGLPRGSSFRTLPDHETKLDGVAAKMKANARLKAQLGGACDQTGAAEFNERLALRRAQAAKAYLVGKGIDAARFEIQSYGFDWARVRADKGKSEGANRRVQVWLHE
jgi:outer membrane protein OmpA-like peptidoglycan-associated protein